MNEDPPILHRLWFLAAIAWLYFLAFAQFRMPLPGAIAAAVTGMGLVFFARTAAPNAEMAWLYGWGTEGTSGIWMRWPLQSLLFFAPLVRHLTIVLSDAQPEEKTLLAVAVGVCWPLGLGIGFWIGMLRMQTDDDRSP